jgi:hypothetical protein
MRAPLSVTCLWTRWVVRSPKVQKNKLFLLRSRATGQCASERSHPARHRGHTGPSTQITLQSAPPWRWMSVGRPLVSVGVQGSIAVDRNGYLFLFANDAAWAYNNTSGHIKAITERQQ